MKPWIPRLAFCAGLTLAGSCPAVPESPASNAVPPELWFPVGETLVYKAYWGFIPVAVSKVTSEWVQEEGRMLLAIRFRTRSNAVIEKIYPVNDFLESVIDPETFLPVRFTKQLSEGRYRADEVTRFDFENKEAHWESRIRPRKKSYPIHEDTRDLIAFMYFMRARPFAVGDEGAYQVMADEKLYDLTVRVTKKEEVKLKHYGNITSLKIEPKAAFEGLFVRKGKLNLWVSEDERKILTQVTVKIPVASVRLKLVEVGGPGEDFWITALKSGEEEKGDGGHESEDQGESESPREESDDFID